MYNIRIGCPWAAAPCGREQEVLKEHGCKGCPAFNEKEFKRIMDAAAKEEMRRAETMEEWRDSFLPENIFGSVDDI